jgi:epoxyqueuosine reductase
MKETSGFRRPDRGAPESLVEQAARAAGFTLVGAASVSPHPRSVGVFERWIAAGKHGEMEYLSAGAAKRRDPTLLLDGARSVICVGVDYYSHLKEQWNRAAPAGGRGRFALYAHGRDYHEVLRTMLADLRRRLEALFPGVKTRALVDTEPISERDVALRAGVGWLGKNTCVISPDYGSWIVLGELLTDLELRPVSPLETLCGDCSKCIDACPTGALNEFSLDARKCISYLTIEKRGDIPSDLHGAIGNRVFGCDECQGACPFNERPKESVVFGGGERNALVSMTLDELVDVSNKDFQKLAGHTAIERCRPGGMRRNARIAATNRFSPPAKESHS